MSVETAQGLLKQARSQLKKQERDLAAVRRLVAAAADELEKTNPTTTDTQEGHRDSTDEDRRTERREAARHAA